jgi:adenylylsulfate kinase
MALDVGRCYWMTGLPGAGKTSIAKGVQSQLREKSLACLVLDGDEIRQGLSSDLAFDRAARRENARRIAEVARLGVKSGLVVVVASLTPFHEDREMARQLVPVGRFVEVHVAASLAECVARDPKGLYARARRGEVSGLTGWDALYELPLKPDIVLHPEYFSLQDAISFVTNHAVGHSRV